ncbi:MAG: putative rane protein [Dehalococcoidia bacterium]|nr:putative rane protein [Dehalococcoidia bacterium]
MLLTILAHVLPPADPSGNVAQGWELWAQWSWANPLLLIPMALGVLYARGLRRWPKPRRLKAWAPYSFYTGLALVVFSLAGPLDAIADDLFSMHMVQHMMLMMIGPPLILLGAPTTPILKGLPRSARKSLVAPLMRSPAAHAVYRFFAHPVTIFLLYTINLWLWHFYGNAYETAAQSMWVHILEHWTFIITASLFWWVVIDPRPMRSNLSYLTRMIFIGVTMLQKVLLGAFITYRHDALYAYYAAKPRLWGLSPLYDQHLAAMWMWIGGTLILLIAIVVVMMVWLEKEEKKSRDREAKEDAARAAAMGGSLPGALRP